MKTFIKLDQLIGLRFFAAMLVVLHHCNDLFGIHIVNFNWLSVTFFFILSGFSLTLVYPSLENFTKIKKFWLSRIARIWPAYLFSFALGFYLVPYHWETLKALPNLLLLQSWIPFSAYYFSYNPVCWSISVEVFFYTVFPLLLFKWQKHWKSIFLICSVFAIAFFYSIQQLHLINYEDPKNAGGLALTNHSLLNTLPISHLFEFTLGMAAATLWQKKSWFSNQKFSSYYEIAILALCIFMMDFNFRILAWSKHNFLGLFLTKEVLHIILFFGFACLIFVIARGHGQVSKLLAHPILVKLGQLSYSIFLLHYVLLDAYRANINYLSHWGNLPSLFAYLSCLLILAYLLWRYIELPCRQILTKRAKITVATDSQKAFLTPLNPSDCLTLPSD